MSGSKSLIDGPTAILIATALMSFQDTVVQASSANLPLWQLFLLRSMIAIPLIVFLIRRSWKQCLRAALAPWTLIRSILIVAMYVCFYAALPVIDLSVVAAVYYTGPLLIVAFSALLLGDRIGRAQFFAMAVAFCGVLLVIRPDQDSFSVAALIPLLSALLYAFAAVATRARLAFENAWSLILSLNIVFVVVGGCGVCILTILQPEQSYPFLLMWWTPVGSVEILVLLTLAVISIGIHLFLARGYQLGPMSVVAGLDFSYLGFAALWAFCLLGTLPAWPTVAGTVFIGLGGLWGLASNRAR
ncbi:DMT family transporter [Rhizobium panacihumi]|uniref:DMT family transporter n=1 Tax=Rhizobium panacihumi TaxID=2008450 RepID=UPI003D7934A2